MNNFWRHYAPIGVLRHTVFLFFFTIKSLLLGMEAAPEFYRLLLDQGCSKTLKNFFSSDAACQALDEFYTIGGPTSDMFQDFETLASLLQKQGALDDLAFVRLMQVHLRDVVLSGFCIALPQNGHRYAIDSDFDLLSFLGQKVLAPHERLEDMPRERLQELLVQVNGHIEYCRNSGLSLAYEAPLAHKRLTDLVAKRHAVVAAPLEEQPSAGAERVNCLTKQ